MNSNLSEDKKNQNNINKFIAVMIIAGKVNFIVAEVDKDSEVSEVRPDENEVVKDELDEVKVDQDEVVKDEVVKDEQVEFVIINDNIFPGLTAG
ncbi:hypothetical protein ACJMK2_031384 [Sinanodonta woodiana]|uniref:Uncharacterized protein n=1 Tax=Sinanodonta woodiana TaxID=1069815 RepID=A0ABD3X2K8_SINWO